ncbi:MAG: hypothetical protein NTV34_02430 [Proteobacteria bacterium]|nr:hypothetical protein [Pseudomonadota bacterium]
MKAIYHIPAPDMDENQIALVRTDGVNIISLELPPILRNTSIDNLKEALCGQIKEQDPILLGFYYGGLLIQEVCKSIPGSTSIVVSRIINHSEISAGSRLAGRTFLYAPATVLKTIGHTLTIVINGIMRVPVKIPRIWRKIPQNKFIIRHSLNFNGIE